MQARLISVKNFFLNLFFPRFCLNCQKEGDYLCPDCLALIDVANYQFCPFCRPWKIVLDGRTCFSCRRHKKLTGLFCAASYQNFIIKKLISQFKYEPFAKELAKPLSSSIIQHFKILDYRPTFFSDRTGFILIPVPLSKKRLKWRGFNQAEEMARQLAIFFKIPLVTDALLKTKETQPQMELTAEARQENIKEVFICQNRDLVKNKNLAFGKNFVSSLSLRNKKILLVDDVFTTGSTMEECARVLKDAGAKEVWGVAAARE